MSITPNDLLQRCHQRAKEALSESRMAHHRGQLAIEEKRWDDAHREFENCNHFLQLSNMFQDQADIFQQMVSGSWPYYEKTQEHLLAAKALLEN